jgi:hypothetical protein
MDGTNECGQFFEFQITASSGYFKNQNQRTTGSMYLKQIRTKEPQVPGI